MTPKKIAQTAIAKMNKKIKDEIFLIIQNDRELMYEYLRAVKANGFNTVDQQIAKEIKKAYSFVNINERENNPSCTLIQSLEI